MDVTSVGKCFSSISFLVYLATSSNMRKAVLAISVSN